MCVVDAVFREWSQGRIKSGIVPMIIIVNFRHNVTCNNV